MKFNPRFHRVQVFSRGDARRAASEAASTLTLEQIARMKRELGVSLTSVKHLNPRMCRKVVEWIEKETEK